MRAGRAWAVRGTQVAGAPPASETLLGTNTGRVPARGATGVADLERGRGLGSDTRHVPHGSALTSSYQRASGPLLMEIVCKTPGAPGPNSFTAQTDA